MRYRKLKSAAIVLVGALAGCEAEPKKIGEAPAVCKVTEATLQIRKKNDEPEVVHRIAHIECDLGHGRFAWGRHDPATETMQFGASLNCNVISWKVTNPIRTQTGVSYEVNCL